MSSTVTPPAHTTVWVGIRLPLSSSTQVSVDRADHVAESQLHPAAFEGRAAYAAADGLNG